MAAHSIPLLPDKGDYFFLAPEMSREPVSRLPGSTDATMDVYSQGSPNQYASPSPEMRGWWRAPSTGADVSWGALAVPVVASGEALAASEVAGGLGARAVGVGTTGPLGWVAAALMMIVPSKRLG